MIKKLIERNKKNKQKTVPSPYPLPTLYWERTLGTLLLSAFIFLGSLAPVQAKLNIIATTPELADITRRVGGEWVVVESLAKGTEDIHAVPQRPSFIPKLNRADGVVLIGLEAEHAFLPALLEVAQNPNILPGKKGYIDCSQLIRAMDVPSNLSRAEGELHPFGNPHYTVDPRNGALIAQRILRGLIELDPTHQSAFEKNHQTFINEWSAALENWKKQILPLKGLKAISYHADMVYFADFLGLELVGTIELKPGIAPTPTHLAELVQRMKKENAKLILREIQYSEKTARWLAEQTKARVATVTTMGGAFPDTQTYIGFIDHNIQSIINSQR